jgi:hypothetical protein
MPSMPMMPLPNQALELKATGVTTNLCGYACTRFELKQRGATMEIWVTDKLPPFHLWLQNQPPRFGPRGIEECWGEMLQGRKLFPLLATLKFENGIERLRFQVQSIRPEQIEDKDGVLFQPPAEYQELEPLPF